MYTIKQFIDGQHVSHSSNKTIDIINPGMGETIGQVEFIDSDKIDSIIESAHLAYLSWSKISPMKRGKVLFNFRQLLENNRDELAQLISSEHGKTLEDAQGEIGRGIEVVEFHCNINNHLKTDFSNEVASHIDCHTVRQALGVCAGVSPFNFPVMTPVWMMIPAIACGNAFILKPSEQDPSAPLKLAELLSEAGLPDGVLTVLNGDKNTVEKIMHHPRVKAVTAIASTPVAESIYTTATSLGKRSHTFGGAKNHCLVMPDADIDQAASAIVGAAYGSAGERCMALSVAVTVGDDTAERLIAAMTPQINAMKIGPGTEPGHDMGALISEAHLNRVRDNIDTGEHEGAKILIDGRQFTHDTYSNGFYMGPTLFDHVTESMHVYQEEIFGPVLCIVRLDNFEQAIELINRHQYGNGTAIFTRDGHAAREYVQSIDAGMVGVNIPIPVPVASHPFGGWKRSVFGNTNMHGLESIHFYTKMKTITTKWPSTPIGNNAFVMPTN